ncbi:SNF2 family N-terminal domain-containing protein [Armillaria novae-zelandiae]|uniref:SNF2 family N-terminal domain-containing protein n=1 Tax=Armillaria novae-zelandiae TaxID=153914 RepID=A0AA39PKR6_9AGAR|nr:SNF2 family N-terminal domain-containing protein [Armillaria novae-zelandiae]
MSVPHHFGYSKSVRAKCHGPLPCKDSAITIGTLRYGQTMAHEHGDTIEWRHWGCVTPPILAQLASTNLENVHGFRDLRSDDQRRIRIAVSERRVDPADIPPSAQTVKPASITSSATSISSQKKRKARREAVSESQRPASSAQVPVTSAHPPSSTPMDETLVVDEIPEEPADELYCTMRTNVVGLQYYNGLVGSGEEVIIQRDVNNMYDVNAVRVLNIGRVQVGHVPRAVAAKLAPLIDRRLITCEGVIHDGNLSGFRGYTLNMSLKFYGASNKRDTLEPLLIWSTPGQRGFGSRRGQVPSSRGSDGSTLPMAGSSRAPGATPPQTEAARKQQEALQKAAELRQIINSLEKVDDERRRNSLLDSVCSTEDILNLPLHPSPPGIQQGNLVVDLMKHQCQGLQWCIEREYPVLPKKESDKPVQFWQLRKDGNKVSDALANIPFEVATKTPQTSPPVLGRGALFADAMGKTLTMIALVLVTGHDRPAHFSNSTLIVVPLSVLSNWEKQIQDHCAPGALTVCVYYGQNRSIGPQELAGHDIVLTTYQTVASEHSDTAPSDGISKKKRKVEKSLFEVQWKRVVLDEGHSIRNPRTKMAKAVCGLSGDRRWVLTGTPIVRSPDLGSILTFLRICGPLDQEDFFKRLLLRPLKDGLPSGVELLRALMSHVCVRRTKEMQDSTGKPLIPLPLVEMTLVPVTLHDDARALYDEIENLSQKRLEGFIARGETSKMQTNVLSMLTRMRQIALHPGLVPRNYLDQLRSTIDSDDSGSDTVPQVKLTPKDKARLQTLVLQAIEDSQSCPICYDIPDSINTRITSCAHMFCLQCISEIISRQGKCPMDRRTLSWTDVIEPPPPTELTQLPVSEDDEEEVFQNGSSAKIEQLIHLLMLMPHSEKSLVFSQFTSFLDKVYINYTSLIAYERFDGRMSAKRRQEVLTRFSVPVPEASQGRQRTKRTAVVEDCDEDAVDDQDSDFVPMSQDNMDGLIVSDDDSSRKKKGKGKAKARVDVDHEMSGEGNNAKVLLLSLKAGALGLNLTVANNVFLWWQEGIESQAIDRVNRIGQKKSVHVYQLIAENTVESKVLDIQEKKKALIKQAFSGTKRTETSLQRKEVRLQEIIELFGIRNQQAQT